MTDDERKDVPGDFWMDKSELLLNDEGVRKFVEAVVSLLQKGVAVKCSS
jgi:hypothetical protein